MDGPTKFCTNCKRDIAERNFVLHSAHCLRYMQICPQCEEPVPQKEMDDHLTEFHAEVSCENCRKTMEKWQVNSHESECPKRLEKCQYCDLPTAVDSLREHESFCGCRSEICRDCKQRVMVKEERFHYLACLGARRKEKISVEPDVKCSKCDLLFKPSVYEEHQKLCSGLEQFMKFRRARRSSASSDEDNTNENSNDVCVLTSEFSSVMHLSGRMENVSHSKSSASALQNQSLYHLPEDAMMDDDRDEAMRQCIYCDDFFIPRLDGSHTVCESCETGFQCAKRSNKQTANCHREEQISKHSGGNSYIKDSQNIYAFGQNRTISRKGSKTTQAVQDFTRTKKWSDMCKFFQESQQHSKEVLSLQPACVYCSKKFPMAEIDDHFQVCPMRVEKCPLCAVDCQVKNLEAHFEICFQEREKCSSIRQNSSGFKALKDNVENDKSKGKLTRKEKKKAAKKRKAEVQKEAEAFLVTNSYSRVARQATVQSSKPAISETRLPCEFCENIFPADELIKHQSGCRPDLLHFPKNAISDNFDDNNIDYAMAACASAQRKTNTAEDKEKKWQERRSAINKIAVVQNMYNEAIQKHPPGQNEISYGRVHGEMYQMLSKEEVMRTSSENTIPSLEHQQLVTVVDATVNSVLQSPPAISKPSDVAARSRCSSLSLMMRGRGRSRPRSHVAESSEIARPGEFLPTTEFAEKNEESNFVSSNDHTASPSGANVQIERIFLDDTSVIGAKKQRCSDSSSKKSAADSAYKFDLPTPGKSVEDVINDIAWKTDYSKNIFHEKDNANLDKTESLEMKVSMINSALDGNIEDRVVETPDESPNQSTQASTSGVASQHIQGVSFKFTATGEPRSAKKRLPYAVRSLRRPFELKSKSNAHTSL